MNQTCYHLMIVSPKNSTFDNSREALRQTSLNISFQELKQKLQKRILVRIRAI